MIMGWIGNLLDKDKMRKKSKKRKSPVNFYNERMANLASYIKQHGSQACYECGVQIKNGLTVCDECYKKV